MNPEYEKQQNSCGIKKNHEINIIVREVSSEFPQSGGELIWTHTGKGYGSMHAVIKAIYSALPDYKGKRIFVKVQNKTIGKFTICSHHHIPLNRIPFKL